MELVPAVARRPQLLKAGGLKRGEHKKELPGHSPWEFCIAWRLPTTQQEPPGKPFIGRVYVVLTKFMSS